MIVSVVAAGDLTDSALTSACSTHSATASISSSTSSLRNRRLADIAESAEEGQVVEKFDIQRFTVVEVSKKESAILGPTVVVTTPDPVIGSTDQPFSTSSLGQGQHTGVAYQRPSLNLATSSLNQRRGSSASDNTRPPITDLYGSLYTPKVKLAPRLSVDTLKRPHSANSNNSGFGSSQEDLRPVASVPKSVHVRKAKDGVNSVTPDTASGPAVPSPSVESSTGEEFSEPTPEVLGTLGPPTPSDPPPLTPEKLRLMRALQLRKNTMKHEGDNSPEVNSDTNVAIEGGLPKTDDMEKLNSTHLEQEGCAVVLGGRQAEASEKAAEHDVENAKVRGSDNENDSDACSVMSVEIAVAQPRPVSTQFSRGAVTTLSAPVNPIPQRSSMPAKSGDVKSPDAPIVLTKHNQKEPPPTSDDPVVETARSVSAPFLSNARRERGSVAIPRTVTVSSGSVFQRIKQLEMLNRNAPTEATPLRSPSVQVRTVTPPSIITVKKKTTKTYAPTPTPLERTPSSQSLHSPTIVHQQPIQVMPPIPPKSDFRPGGRPAEYRSIPLQVTTKIPRQNDKAVQTDEITAAQLLARAATSPPDVNVPSLITPLIQGEASTPIASNRKSLDTTSVSKGQKSSESVKEKTTFREKATNLLHKLNIELETLPPLPMSPLASPRSTSPVDPSPPGGRPKSLFGRDKEKSAEKKQKKAEKEKEKERSREREREKEDNGSPKSEKKSLLRRMSSLTRIVREPTPAPALVQVPVETPPKKNLLAGWVNVQLPDTMLWRRKCIKVDSTGWLFLAVTDDENGPGTRKYHIPSDVRLVRIPDPDEQELPFSVQLDLYEGGTLQCACQNSLEQKEVLTGEIE